MGALKIDSLTSCIGRDKKVNVGVIFKQVLSVEPLITA
jgi:hypothetical protein